MPQFPHNYYCYHSVIFNFPQKSIDNSNYYQQYSHLILHLFHNVTTGYTRLNHFTCTDIFRKECE